MLGRIVAFLILVIIPQLSWAQQPHFTVCDASAIGRMLFVFGQVAGLGNQMRPPTPLKLEATLTAACIDQATEPPTLVSTATAVDSTTYPPKNGNRRYAFPVATPIALACDPPNIVAISIEVCDTTHAICCTPLPPPATAPEPEPEPEPEPQPE